MLDETFPDSRVFHGHVREWKGGPGAQGLSQDMQNALIKNGDVNRK